MAFPSKRALPFKGKAIKFGELCVLQDGVNTYVPNEYGSFNNALKVLAKGTIIVPLECFRGGWRNEMVRCIVGGNGFEYIRIDVPVERVE